MEPKRKVIKGPILPPGRQTKASSYTQAPSSKDVISVRNSNSKPINVTEFSSRAVPQPFLDPSIMQLRMQAEKQAHSDQERKNKEEASSSRA